MKITSIRHDKDAGREMMTVYDADVLMEKIPEHPIQRSYLFLNLIY